MPGFRSRRPDEPEGPPPELTITSRDDGGVEVTEVVGFGRTEESAGSGGPGRRWPWVVAGAAAVLVAGGLGAVRLLDDSSAMTSDGFPLAAAVTTEPAEAWTHDYDGSYLSSVAGVGDHVVFAEQDGDVVGLDADGEEAWRYDEHSGSFVVAVGGTDDKVLVEGSGNGLGVISTEDGAELWWRDEGFAVGVREGMLIVGDAASDSGPSERTAVRLDPATGEELWAADGVDDLTVTADAVYVVGDGALRRLDPDTGEETWSTDVGSAPRDGSQLVGTHGLVALARGSVVTAYGAVDGKRLWSYEGSDDPSAAVNVGAYDDDRVYVGESVYDAEGESTNGTVTVRDREGEVGSFELEGAEFLYGFGIETDDAQWFLSLGSGDLYDDDVELAAHYDGQVVAADQGVYAIQRDTLSYVPYGDADPAWQLDVDRDVGGGVWPVDDGVLVSGDGTLTAYR